MQIAVLMITTGTILGGLWADVSWGRFWGWDSKEVGALTALLILLTALHGRRAGWPGDLTLAIGSVAGFFGVLWAWYVVNWLLPAGMHSYGAGEGGRWLWLVIVVGGESSSTCRRDPRPHRNQTAVANRFAHYLAAFRQLF